ncbi:hypothetical protein ACHAXN_002375 [Cyclotella atomus]
MPVRIINCTEQSAEPAANKLKTSIIVSQQNSFESRKSNVVMDSDEDDPLLCQQEEEDDTTPIKQASEAVSNDGGACQQEMEMTKRRKRQFDYQKFNDKRIMSAQQERWNAVTMLPAMVYGAYFVLAGCWLGIENIEMARRQSEGRSVDNTAPTNLLGHWMALAATIFSDKEFDSEDTTTIISGCINFPWLTHLHAFPPLPVLAGALGIVVHAPFSFLYHWTYATKLHPSKRLEHWSRRLDHAFIHFASACMAYATSGNVPYFLVNIVYNLDCALKQFEEKVRPRRNQTRIAISILLYILPVLQRGDYRDFAQLILIFTWSGWFFIVYPIGGYSHAMFHVVVAFLPNVIMKSACKLEVSREQIELAARCAVRAGV